MSKRNRYQKRETATLERSKRSGLALATMASYDGAMPDKTRQMSNRIGTNPNSAYAQQQRVTLMWQAEDLVKNSDWVSVCYSLKQYCQPIGYLAQTGDPALDSEVNQYMREVMKRGGINQSALQAFSCAAHVEMPVRGDSILERYDDETQLRFIVRCADQIGELYRFVNPASYGAEAFVQPPAPSVRYIAGIFIAPNGMNEAFKIYERGYNQTYLNPQIVPACNVIYFQDNLFDGHRGVTKFAPAIQSIQKRNKIWQSGMDSMAIQSKIAAIASNASGSPDPLDYETTTNSDGTITYTEKMADGAVVKYQFTDGDSYQFMKSEAPGAALLQGLDYSDERTCLSLGFPKAFLISARDGGGAPTRFDMSRAGREIMRLRNDVYLPRLEKMAYLFLMDGIARKKLPARAGVLNGNWHWPSLPSADAFRDDKSDVEAMRAGLTTRTAIIAKNGDGTFEDVLALSTQEAIAIEMATQDANRELVKRGYKPTVADLNIAQDTPNPTEKPQGEAPAKAAMAFDEGKHPRADDGKFGEGGGGAKVDAPEPAKGDKPAPSGGGKGDEDDGIDSKISNVRDGKGSMEFFHGTSMRDADLHIGKTFTDNQTTADNYAAEKTFQGNVDLNGLKIAKVKRFDREDANYGAVGDSNSDIADLQDRGIDLIEYDDEDPSGREHSAYRIVSDKALDRFKDGVSLRDNRIHSLANDLSENELIGKTKEEVLEKIKTLSVEDIFKMAVEHEPDNDEEFVTRIFKDAGVKLPAKYVAKMADWDESKHKRSDDGKFGEGGGGAKADAPEPAKGDKPAPSGGGKGDEMGEGADGKPKKVSEMSKGEKKTHDMRKKLEALRAKNAEGAQKLAAINARTADLHKQLVEQLKTGTGTANDDLKKTVNELGAKIAETEMQTKSIQHALRGEDIAADEHGQDSPQHEAARKRTEYVADKAK